MSEIVKEKISELFDQVIFYIAAFFYVYVFKFSERTAISSPCTFEFPESSEASLDGKKENYNL